MTEGSKIIVVDDDPIVRKLLKSWLEKAGYAVYLASEGEEGLSLAFKENPDVILLDVMMPKMDGFEVCRRLKDDPATKEIPVIFLSAKTESQDKVHGLEVGAADYINKPFDLAEVMARIEAHIRLKKQEEQLKKYAHDLEDMVEERTKQLIHAERLVSLGTLSAGIAHEINNPTTFILGNLQTLEHFWADMLPYLKAGVESEKNPNLEFIINEMPKMIESMKIGTRRITEIVSGLKTFARREPAEKTMVDVNECINDALKLTHNKTKYYIKSELDLDPDLPQVLANSQQLTQVFVNLLINASDAIGERPGKFVISSKLKSDGKVEITFTDDGPGMSPEVLNCIFDPFFTTKPIGTGTGLGLSISHGIISDHQGSIDVKSSPNQGTSFILTLPGETPLNDS